MLVPGANCIWDRVVSAASWLISGRIRLAQRTGLSAVVSAICIAARRWRL